MGLSACETMKTAAPEMVPAAVEAGTALGFIKSQDNLSALAGAIEAAGLAGALSGRNAVTVFAPSNAAIEAAGDVSADILKLHVVEGAADIALIVDAVNSGNGEAFIDTLGGRIVTRTKAGELYFRGQDGGAARAINSDNILPSGSVVHIIDAVIGTGPLMLGVDT